MTDNPAKDALKEEVISALNIRISYDRDTATEIIDYLASRGYLQQPSGERDKMMDCIRDLADTTLKPLEERKSAALKHADTIQRARAKG